MTSWMEAEKRVCAHALSPSHKPLINAMHKGTHTGGQCSLRERWPSCLPGFWEDQPDITPDANSNLKTGSIAIT